MFEPLRMHLVCGFEHPVAPLVYLIGKSVMDLSRGHQADACVVVDLGELACLTEQ